MAAKYGDSHSQQILNDVLPGVQPVADDDCPLRHGKPDRSIIEAWINMLLAVVDVESRFNLRARAPKNARGLMALMPATARRFEVEDIRNPFENLRGGMAYLSWLMDHYESDLELSLATCNAG